MSYYAKFAVITVFTCCIYLTTAQATFFVGSSNWVTQSNESAELLSRAFKAGDCQPTFSSSESLQEIDPAFKVCMQDSVFDVIQTLEQKLIQAENSELRLDLEILLKAARHRLRLYKLNEKYRVPYINLSEAILKELEATSEEISSSSQRRQVILNKLKIYAGLEPGQRSLVSFLEQAIKTQLQRSEVVLPAKKELEEDLDNNASQITKILAFLKQQEVLDYQDAYAKLKTQLFNYEAFIRTEVLTQEKSVRLPKELYAFELERHGIETHTEELIRKGHTAFTQIQQQMEEIAQKIASQRGFKISSYRDVIQVLKQEQLSAKETLNLYRKRAKELETIVKRQNLVTLPTKNKLHIRLATTEEKKSFPVPFYESNSNTFIIPVFRDLNKEKLYNDFTNPATSWTLMAHEGRPGHELQYTTIKNHNLSLARAYFAANPTNIEGWATYAEEMMRPYLTIEGQFMSLQFQLLRAARAFLEPEIQLERTTTVDALKVLMVDTGFSQFFAEQEIERYISRSPGQAPSYFYGSQRLLELRERAQKKLGNKFTLKKFHDFVLSQGFLPPELLRQAIDAKMT